jgi:MFS family permease
MTPQPVYGQVLLLASAQALFVTASAMVTTIGGLAGGQVAPAPEFATAPIAASFLGTALATVPAALWMMRKGRRPGFIAGASLGAAGGLLAATGMWIGSLLVLSLGTFLVGAYQGFAQFYRFAASEVATPTFRSRAISLVLAGGVVAAILGPMLGRLGRHLIGPDYVGSFLLLTAVSGLAALLLLMLRVPKAEGAHPDALSSARPLTTIIRQPTYTLALLGAATGYGVMILAMTATPIAMLHHEHDLAAATLVIQLHILGMFIPSFFTGALIGRLGVIPFMLAGIALMLTHVLLTLTGTGFYSFAAALIVLGIGWNFLYVGGTALLTGTYSAAERGHAQAFNDLTVFVVSLIASLAAGALQQTIGWQALNVLLLPWLALTGLALVWRWLGPNENEIARPQTVR